MASTKATSTLTVNAAFLQEIKEVNQELWQLLGNLRKLCQAPFQSSTNVRELTSLLEMLRDQLALHFSLEEAYGYFEDPVWVAPRLSDQAEKLRGEHRQLYLQASEIAEFIAQVEPDQRLAEVAHELSTRFESFYQQLLAHEAREDELILAAYDEDIGVGD